jgi:hypothetical protein
MPPARRSLDHLTSGVNRVEDDLEAVRQDEAEGSAVRWDHHVVEMLKNLHPRLIMTALGLFVRKTLHG